MSVHQEGEACSGCEMKLSRAHPKIADWFKEVKGKYPDVHVAWAYRGEQDQEQSFQDGKTLLHYPHSAHNRVNEEGKPESLALDLFQLQNHEAVFNPIFYLKLWEEYCDHGIGLQWGGLYRSLGDRDHFQVSL